MKQFNKTLLATGIVLALGAASSAWANPTNTATEVVESQTASVDSTAKGQGNSSISEGGTSTIGAITDTKTITKTETDTNNSQDNDVKESYNQDNDTKTITKTDTNNSQDNDVKESYNQ
ncbi:MAG: hypothetical protein KGZ80_05765, partial [Methylomonas sp.]|nr:hypothetical protein [Methylomonas sp.]